ncbi:MAG: DUF2237 domain-containing protein [Vampirovibrionales bacterium]|nr:DUF2237 domain-containing protein [Vampirovibrionales bacterium]
MSKTNESVAKNVLGTPLQPCSQDPLTGYFRDGCCNTDASDFGSHTVCVQLTEQFLTYSKAQGNDLSTPNPDYHFPGLKAGDRWCLCAPRWKQAFDDGLAPSVILESTHEMALEYVSLEQLKAHAFQAAH